MSDPRPAIPRPEGAAHRPGEGDAELLVSLAPQLLIRLSAVLRTARTHDVSNQAFHHQLQDFQALLLQLLEEENEVALVAVADYFYLNGVRIKAQASMLAMYHSLMGEFERRDIGGLRFLQAVNEAELERFFQLFKAADDPAMAEHLPEAIEAAHIQGVALLPRSDIDADDLTRSLDDKPEHQNERGRARRVFWRAVLGTKKIVLRARQTGRPDLRHAKRVVQPVVDGIMKHEYSIVGMTAVKDHDEYTYAHCVNVSVLSVSMGQALGLNRQQLADLGVAALLHDIGKLSIPGDTLRKPAALTAEEWVLMRRHPLEGAKMVIRMPGLSQVMLDTMRVCLEHHMNFDRTGYPEITLDWGQSAMSRIVALADCFDAMTAHRAYHKRARTSYEALQYLLGPNRVQFDPAVLWALAKSIGLYPAGSVLLTASGHAVLAISPNPRDVRRPHCRVIVRPDGSPVPEDAPELWEPMPDSDSVARVLRPEDVPVNTGELLAA